MVLCENPNTMFGSRRFSIRHKSCMVAERCLSASLPVVENSPTPHRCTTMAEEQIFIPTHMADYSGEVIGDILMDITCKALLAGQCFMTVGGYVVRGLRLACNKRAKAIRFPNGAFERGNPNNCHFMLGPLQQPPLLSIMHAADDLAAAASSICLAIQENTPSPEPNLMPQLEQQAAIEASDLPVQDLVQ